MISYHKLYALVILLFISILSGCAAKQERTYLFPPQPVQPRFVYVRSYTGASDFRKPGLFDKLFGGDEISSLKRPYGIFVEDDVIYVAVTQEASLLVMDNKKMLAYLVGVAGGKGRLLQPIGVVVSAEGTIFVSDSRQKKVFGYSKLTGDLEITIGEKEKNELTHPVGLAISNTLKRLYIADSFGHMVHVYSTSGEKLFDIGSRGDVDGAFNFPSNVAVDKRNDDIYVVDTQNFRVQAFDKEGKFLRKFGSSGDITGSFSRPKGIGVDSEGNVYVVDAAFENFQIFNDKGQILMHLGSPGSQPGQFALPSGLFVDEKDRVYVVDSVNERVQVFQYLSEKWQKENSDEYNKYLDIRREEIRKAEEEEARLKDLQKSSKSPIAPK